MHPPVPTDVRVTEDADLDLAGLKVRAVRIPGHTAGSMAWQFEKGGKKYVAFGDLIMPRRRPGLRRQHQLQRDATCWPACGSSTT